MIMQIYDKADKSLSAKIDLGSKTLEEAKQWFLNTYTGCIEDIEYIVDVRTKDAYRFGDLKRVKVQQLLDLLDDLYEARACSRNLGSMYNYMHEDEHGWLVINFFERSRDDKRTIKGLDRCLIRWDDVIMTEDCYAMAYDPNVNHPLLFKFNYFADNQQIGIRPEQLYDETLQSIYDWIIEKIAY